MEEEQTQQNEADYFEYDEIDSLSDLPQTPLPDATCMHCGQDLILSHQEDDVDYEYSESGEITMRDVMKDIYVQPEGKPCKDGCGHHPKGIQVYHNVR